MDDASSLTNEPDSSRPAGESDGREAFEAAGPGSSSELQNWTSTLAVVFLAGATLNSGMRWCARGTSWDAAGAILSGLLGYVVYRLTISDKMLPSVSGRWLASILPVILWALVLPILMWGLGFPG